MRPFFSRGTLRIYSVSLERERERERERKRERENTSSHAALASAAVIQCRQSVVASSPRGNHDNRKKPKVNPRERGEAGESVNRSGLVLFSFSVFFFFFFLSFFFLWFRLNALLGGTAALRGCTSGQVFFLSFLLFFFFVLFCFCFVFFFCKV